MKSWITKPVQNAGAPQADSSAYGIPENDTHAAAHDIERFERLMNAPPAPGADAGTLEDQAARPGAAGENVTAGARLLPRNLCLQTLSMSGESIAPFPQQRPGEKRHEEAGPKDMPAQLPFSGNGMPAAVANAVAAAVESQAAARVDIADLVERLSARIAVEAPASVRPAVDIQLNAELLPDTAIRIARGTAGLEVILSTRHEEAHTVLCAAADALGGRLAALEGGIAVHIKILKGSELTLEVLFDAVPDRARGGLSGPRRKMRDGKA